MNVGDKVIVTKASYHFFSDGKEVVISDKYDTDDGAKYSVQDENGTSQIVQGCHLTLAPKFKIGEAVRFADDVREFTFGKGAPIHGEVGEVCDANYGPDNCVLVDFPSQKSWKGLPHELQTATINPEYMHLCEGDSVIVGDLYSIIDFYREHPVRNDDGVKIFIYNVAVNENYTFVVVDPQRDMDSVLIKVDDVNVLIPKEIIVDRISNTEPDYVPKACMKLKKLHESMGDRAGFPSVTSWMKEHSHNHLGVVGVSSEDLEMYDDGKVFIAMMPASPEGANRATTKVMLHPSYIQEVYR